MRREFRRLCNWKLHASSIFLVSNNILTSLMESWCIVFVGNQSFGGQNWPKDGFRTLYFPAVYKKFRCGDSFHPQTLLFTKSRPKNVQIPGVDEGKRRRKLDVNKDKWIFFKMTRTVSRVNSYLRKSIKSHWLKSWHFGSWKLNLKACII